MAGSRRLANDGRACSGAGRPGAPRSGLIRARGRQARSAPLRQHHQCSCADVIRCRARPPQPLAGTSSAPTSDPGRRSPGHPRSPPRGRCKPDLFACIWSYFCARPSRALNSAERSITIAFTGDSGKSRIGQRRPCGRRNPDAGCAQPRRRRSRLFDPGSFAPPPPPRAARCRSADRIDGLDIVAFCPDRTQIRGAPALRPPRGSSA